MGDELLLSQEGVPPGYEAVSLIEALNGPCPVLPPSSRTPFTRLTLNSTINTSRQKTIGK